MVSAASRRTASTRDAGSLGRLVGERAVEARIRRGETPLDDELRSNPSLRKTRSRVSSTRRTRSRRTARTSCSSTDSEDDWEEPSRRRRRASHRAPQVDSETEDEGVYVSRSPEMSNASLPSHAAQKPRLPTILSSGYDDRGSSGVDNNEPAHPLSVSTNFIPRSELAKPKTQPAISLNVNLAIPA